MNTLPQLAGMSDDNIREAKEQVDRQVKEYNEYSLELSDDINVKVNYFGTPNNIFDIISQNKLSQTEFCIYLYLYRMSYGWHRNWCRVGHDKIHAILDMALQTIKTSINKLAEKGCITIIDEGKMTIYGTLY